MTALVSFHLTYDAKPKVKAFSPEQYEKLRVVFTKLPEDQSLYSEWGDYSAVGFLEDLKIVSDMELDVTVSRVRGQFMEEGPFRDAVVAAKSGRTPDITVVNVSIPNAGLFEVRSVTVIQDACTDHIQEVLDKGWRIIAVCPPNDTRRPTYVMGHFKEGAHT
jgi:hypothetical protein